MPRSHRIMCEDAQDQSELDEIVAGVESEINDDHNDIVHASDPWTPVFSDVEQLTSADSGEFHLPSEVD